MDKQSSIQGRETTSAEVSWATLPRMLSGECSRSRDNGNGRGGESERFRGPTVQGLTAVSRTITSSAVQW